ncbi:hypothetical protein Btru_043643 [Bulinus truncatus]|nr:hypothetical protein Btru_043643 [Bulinus truncatus]
MPISEHEEKMLNLRTQVQQNQVELQDYLSDLKKWEKDIKKKEDVLKSEKTEKHHSELPPVRNTVHRKKLKKIKKEKPVDQKKPKRISGYDFKAWDKFDVDKALEEVDKDKTKSETSSSEYETDEEWEQERKKYLAGVEKDKGNEFLKKGEIEKAIEAYSKGMQYDPTNAILPANRAMALLKQQKFAASELDCTLSLTLDPLYVKAYLRRATARSCMSKLNDAIADYRRVLDLEPSNKQAKTELDRLLKEVGRECKESLVSSFYTDGPKGIVKPIYKPPDERSKLPLRNVPISEIGLKPQKTQELPNRDQSDLAKKITAKEGKEFDKFMNMAPPSSSTSSKSNLCLGGVSPISGSEMTILPEKVSSCDKMIHSDSGTEINSTYSYKKNECSENVCETEHKDGVSNTFMKSDMALTSIQSSEVSKIKSCEAENGSGDSFGVPTTSFQFQSDFKLLRNKPESFIHYFQAISPSKYAQLFGQCLDVDILKTILTCLKIYYSSLKVNLYDVLYNLTQVKRFSMTAMFMSKNEKQVANDLIQLLEKESKIGSTEQIALLRKKYDL